MESLDFLTIYDIDSSLKSYEKKGTFPFDRQWNSVKWIIAFTKFYLKKTFKRDFVLCIDVSDENGNVLCRYSKLRYDEMSSKIFIQDARFAHSMCGQIEYGEEREITHFYVFAN